LLARRVDVITIDVRVREHVNELVWLELDLAGDEMKQERVLGHVEGHAEHEVARALIHHQRELPAGHEELEQRMTCRERCLFQLAGVPGVHDHPPARGLLADEADRVAQLVDVPAVGCDPVAPLLPVIAAGVAGKTSAAPPVIGERVAVPDVHAERVQVVDVGASSEEPEELRHDGAEREPFCRHRGESAREVETHHLAEYRAGADAGAIRAIVALFERLPQDVEVLAHCYASMRRWTRPPVRSQRTAPVSSRMTSPRTSFSGPSRHTKRSSPVNATGDGGGSVGAGLIPSRLW